jgi:hypothetical protein
MLSVGLAAAIACGSASPPPAPDAVTGLIVAIDRDDAGTIESFTVHQGGEPYEIRIRRGRDYGFDLEHLAEHRTGRLPVRVTLEERDGDLYAVRILDA